MTLRCSLEVPPPQETEQSVQVFHIETMQSMGQM
jgi:hypothetical protein